MTATKEQELLKELVSYLDTSMKAIYVKGQQLSLGVGTCYTVSKVGAKIMRRLGYEASISKIGYIVADKIGAPLYLQHKAEGIERTDDILAAGGWVMGVGWTTEPYDFHFVIYLKDREEIIDLTFGQADRPKHNIRTKPFWAKLDALPDIIIDYRFRAFRTEDHQSAIFYQPEVEEYMEHMVYEGYKLLKKYKVK